VSKKALDEMICWK